VWHVRLTLCRDEFQAAAEGAVQAPSPPPHPKAWAPRIKRTSGLPHWWNRTFDTALLAGSYKHGMPNTAFRKYENKFGLILRKLYLIMNNYHAHDIEFSDNLANAF
jgi:hypothetical protein